MLRVVNFCRKAWYNLCLILSILLFSAFCASWISEIPIKWNVRLEEVIFAQITVKFMLIWLVCICICLLMMDTMEYISIYVMMAWKLSLIIFIILILFATFIIEPEEGVFEILLKQEPIIMPIIIYSISTFILSIYLEMKANNQLAIKEILIDLLISIILSVLFILISRYVLETRAWRLITMIRTPIIGFAIIGIKIIRYNIRYNNR